MEIGSWGSFGFDSDNISVNIILLKLELQLLFLRVFDCFNLCILKMDLPIVLCWYHKIKYHYSSYGPTFDGGHIVLFVYNLSNTNRHSYMMLEYEGGQFIVGVSDNFFQTVEIEVFQVS